MLFAVGLVGMCVDAAVDESFCFLLLDGIEGRCFFVDLQRPKFEHNDSSCLEPNEATVCDTLEQNAHGSTCVMRS